MSHFNISAMYSWLHLKCYWVIRNWINDLILKLVSINLKLKKYLLNFSNIKKYIYMILRKNTISVCYHSLNINFLLFHKCWKIHFLKLKSKYIEIFLLPNMFFEIVLYSLIKKHLLTISNTHLELRKYLKIVRFEIAKDFPAFNGQTNIACSIQNIFLFYIFLIFWWSWKYSSVPPTNVKYLSWKLLVQS